MKFQASTDWRKILSGVRETRLDNGMVGLVLPCSGIASVVTDIYYAGGSSCDPSGRRGLTHFLEHMLYNGTRRVPRGMLDKLILRLAGQHNAETGPDFTHFWCQTPRHALDLILALEADRMTGATLTEADLERERTIILEEEARYREQPFEELMMRVMADLFAGHPYDHATIGTSEDLKATDCSDLRSQYRRMFQPANAVVVVAGDVRPARAIDLIHKHFGNLKSECHGRVGVQLKPPTNERFDGRNLVLESSEVVPRGAMLWPAPGPFDMASRAWGVAATILGGGRSSRLWRALVEDQALAAHVGVALSEERLGGYLLIDLELNPGTDPELAETAVFEVLAAMAADGPDEEEVRRAAVQRAAAARWARQQASTLAGALGVWSLFADWHQLAEAWVRDDLVTVADVRDVMASLKRDNLFRGWTVPAKPASNGRKRADTLPVVEQSLKKPTLVQSELERQITEAPLDDSISKLLKRAQRPGPGYKSRSMPVKQNDLHGMAFITESLGRKGVCCAELRWRGGWMEEAIPGLATITARVCEELIDPVSGRSFSELFEEIGASIDSGSTGFSAQGLQEDLPQILKYLGRMIWSPRWSAETLKRVTARTRTELEADLDDPAFQAELQFRRMVYAGMPGQEDARGTLESLKQITLAAVRGHFANFFHPANAIFGLSGGFRAEKASDLVQKSFLAHLARDQGNFVQSFDWHELNDKPLPAGQACVLRSPGTQTHLVIGHRTLPRTHPDWVALQALEVALGSGPGLTDMLTRRLRDELGIVYSVNLATAEGAWRSPGALRVSFSCDPADAEFAEAETLSILQQVSRGEISDNDCDEARDYLSRSWPMAYEAADDRLACWLDCELEDWHMTLPPVWVSACMALTPDRMREAARRWIRPDMLQTVRYGP